MFDVDNPLNDALAEQILNLLGDDYLVKASDLELIGLRGLVVTATTLGS